MFLSCFTVASNTTGDKTVLLGKVPYSVCVSFLIVQYDIRGYLSIHASHNCSIIPIYWIMFCVILAALLSSISTISTIKPLPSEDSGIASAILFCRRNTTSVRVNTLWERHPRYKIASYTEHQHPDCWRMAVHYGWILWYVPYPISTSPTA